jgi:ribosomal protein S18 acetylase RimI-like enzyme
MEEKTAEFRHDKARYLLAIDDDERLAGFVHFRFEYDDEASPSCAVSYIFEIQIESAYRRCGLGKRLMEIAERIARDQSMTKVVLTVFKKNHQAMAFYTKSLGYDVDETSPSKFGEIEDYEILSLKLK